MSLEPKGWLARLTSGLSRSSDKLAGGFRDLFAKRKLDGDAIEALEELLITADLGVKVAARLAANFSKTRFDKDVDEQEVRKALAADIADLLEPVAKPLNIDTANKPHVILVCGVNGSGKTTTIGKLASSFKQAGHSAMLVAGDTFRAAAVEQLRIWGERTGCAVFDGAPRADAAGLAFDAIAHAKARGIDVVLIDTAGRLQNKQDLMEELAKINRVVKKQDESAPHDRLLVMDATVGQNALRQVQTFSEMVRVSGLAVTKLDGTAKGGIVVALADKFKLPIHAIGVGEGIDDLRPFKPSAFAEALMGLRPQVRARSETIKT